jgi:hypothetical protein
MYIIIILSTLLVVCGYIIFNLLRKIERVEDAFTEASTLNTALYTALRGLVTEMESIDEDGAFQSDDQVGGVFKQLRHAITSVSELFTEEEE